MKNLKSLLLPAALALSSALGASEARQELFSARLLSWLDQAASENRAGAPREAIASCKRAIKDQLADIAPSLRNFSLPTGHDQVVYVTSSPGWGGIHVAALSIGKAGASLSYSDGDTPSTARIAPKDASSIEHVLEDMRPYQFGYTPGWKDGECGLFVIQLHDAQTIALLPPGGRIDSAKGDVVRAFLDWADTRWPEEKN